MERFAAAGVTHSQVILPLIDELLAEAGLGLRELDCVAFGAGPGGFTGLRLGCAVAQGLALAADLPVVAVGSLEALALGCGKEKVYACVDARMSEVYCAAYRGNESECVMQPLVAPPDSVPAPPGTDWHGAGSGFAAYAAKLERRLAGVLAAIDAAALPSAAAVARIGWRRFQRGEGVDAALAAPLYVRDKVALTTAERVARESMGR